MVVQTKTGLFIRQDSNLGVLIYSPYTGLFFSCLEEDEITQKLLNWLRGGVEKFEIEKYTKSVGAGWYVAKNDALYPPENVLSSSGMKLRSKKSDYPILINWLITYKCSCRCPYCYARDVMMDGLEPDKVKAKQIANTILSYKPLAVVLTGGDPLCSPNIIPALEELHGKTGIIIDTNGVGITEKHVMLFKQYNVFVRISLDSERPKINNAIRPLKNSGCSLSLALDCINLCLRNDVSIGIQTVVTKINMSDIEPLSYKLFRLGVTNWRIQMLANHSRFDEYGKLKPNIKRYHKNIVKTIGKKNKAGWDETMSIQQINNTISNAVILVSPQGEFLTEFNGKVAIDEKNRKKPTLKAIRSGTLNLDAHTDRYLNLDGNKLSED